MSDTQWCKWLNNMAQALVVELYHSVVILAIGNLPVCIIPRQWASLLDGNLFSVTTVIDTALKYRFPYCPNFPPLCCVLLFCGLCCVFIYLCCVDLRWDFLFGFFHFLSDFLPFSLPGGRDGSVQSDASSSPSEPSQLGQSHPGYPMGPQVSG